MFDFVNCVKEALATLRGTQATQINVQGKNKDIEEYYNIWRGVPSWLDYNYRLPNGNTEKAKLKTLNIPRYICRTWANNYANEDTSITISGDKDNARLQEIFNLNNLFGRFNNFCEMFMGLGIGATTVEIDVIVDKETKKITKLDKAEIKIKMIPGRRVIPITIDDGEVTECAFVSYITGGARLTIHYLVNGVYHLATFNATTNGNNNGYSFDYRNFTDIPLSTIPLFQIWHPNLTDEDELDRCVGTSIFSTALDTFKHLDLGYTAYYKEVKLGQKVKFMSTDQLDYDKDGNTILPFDENDESIVFMKNANENKTQMQEFNGELRIEAITKYINTNLNCAAMLCGLGQTQFEFDGGGGRPIQTATGVIAKQTELYRNVIKQENLATAKFKQLVMAIAYMNNTFTSKQQINIKSLNDIVVTYDDNIVEDTASKKTSELAEVNAGVMSIAEFRSHWYDESEDDAKLFVQENALLLEKYLPALQAKAITPEIYVDLVFGENYKNKQAIIDYINSSKQMIQTGFEDEEDDDIDDETKKDDDKDKDKDDE